MGFALCCSSNPIPDPINATFTFGSGTNAATYSNALQNTSLTYYPNTSFPAYHPFPTLSSRFISPLMTDSFSQQFYYTIACNNIGQFNFAQGFPGFGVPSQCATPTLISCSPFLLRGFSTGSNFCGQGFGTHSGDQLTVS